MLSLTVEKEAMMTPIGLTPRGLSDAKSASLERAKQLAATLLSERGEASGALVARQLHEALGALDAGGRHGFQRYVATEFQPDKAALRAAAKRYLADGTAEAAATLAQAADPPRQELLRRMNMAPGGTGALIAMRSEIASCLRSEPEPKLLDADLRHLFASWFNRGFLEPAAHRLADAGRGAGKADRL
jgi:malonyl-CoA decarboxylase